MPATPEQCRKYLLRVRKRARKLFGFKCWCGRRGKEFAHLCSTGLSGPGRGMKNRYRDVLRHPECYQFVCSKQHHWALDNALAEASGAEIVLDPDSREGIAMAQAGEWLRSRGLISAKAPEVEVSFLNGRKS
jgi:hypothetical protein